MGKEETENQPTQLEKKIIRQIEYYFGDKNLPRDKFLQDKIHQNDGWVSLECLITFNRLKSLTTDFDVILNALKKSKNGLLEIDSENKKIKRNPEKAVPSSIDPELNRVAKLKTLYVKGFPTDYALDQVEEFFEGKWEVIFIKMRRNGPESFKGSIFVEFATQEMASDFLAQELKIGETVLEKMTREDYYKKKDEEKKLEKQKGKPGGDVKEEEEEKEPFVTGCVLHFKGAGEGTSREDLKGLFGEKHEIAWVDFNRNDTEGFIRFKGEGTAQQVIDAVKEANDGKIMIKGVETTVRILEDEEEKKFWEKSQKDREMILQRRANKGKRFNRGQKRTREDRKPIVKNGDKKPAPSGEHKRFDDDAGPKSVDEDEPKVKQVKAE